MHVERLNYKVDAGMQIMIICVEWMHMALFGMQECHYNFTVLAEVEISLSYRASNRA